MVNKAFYNAQHHEGSIHWNDLCFRFQAQAQECILEKSMTDNRKSSITAKVAAQIINYYKTACKNLDKAGNNVVGSKRFKVRISDVM